MLVNNITTPITTRNEASFGRKHAIPKRYYGSTDRFIPKSVVALSAVRKENCGLTEGSVSEYIKRLLEYAKEKGFPYKKSVKNLNLEITAAKDITTNEGRVLATPIKGMRFLKITEGKNEVKLGVDINNGSTLPDVKSITMYDKNRTMKTFNPQKPLDEPTAKSIENKLHALYS